MTDWTVIYEDEQTLRDGFAGYPDARYRPVVQFWWSGERLAREKVLWQVEQVAKLGCGGLSITGLAMYGAAADTVADDPRALSEEWYAHFFAACERARELGLGVTTWSPLQVAAPVDVPRLLEARPELRGEEVLTADGVDVRPFGYDWGSAEAMAAFVDPSTKTGEYLERIAPLLGDTIVALFEDEFVAFPRWAPGFADDFRASKGYEFPLEAMDQDVGPRTPAYRVDLVDVATERVLGAYTKWQTDFVSGNRLLGGYDQCSRRGTPLLTSLYHFDQFKTMAWANAPGTDHMGDARFHLSLADIYGAPRVWFEGFHSMGWGLTLDDQMRLIYEWGREGASLHLPVCFYYTTKALWWEWAPPDLGWVHPHAAHYPKFAEAVGRLFSALSAGKHVPEIAVLFPQTTVWADTEGTRRWGAAALEADNCYIELFGMHSVPSGKELERADRPSLLGEAFYDRITVDEENVSLFDVPIVLPACMCLRTETVKGLIRDAERGRVVVIVEPRPAWSAENGRDDAEFAALVEQLCELATVVSSPAEAVAALPPPRVGGLKSQWRRVGDLDLVFLTGTGAARLRGMADRAPELWDPLTGATAPHPARADGDDLIVECGGPAALLALPRGVAAAPRESADRELELPDVWQCEYIPWGENRWGDLRLPPNEGTPPTERRTFAFREGDDPTWRNAPVTPEDVQQPMFELGFEQRMSGANGRVPPSERTLPDGWREVVSTYGPKLLANDEPAEYSERLGVEDVLMTTPIGIKGWIEPVKIDFGPEGAGVVRSWCRIDDTVDTHLVVEGGGVVAVTLDGTHLIGPVECGVLSIPVHLEAGWHELRIEVEPRSPEQSAAAIYRQRPRTRLGWVFSSPFHRSSRGIWSWKIIHPDLKGDPGPKRFRRLVRVSEPTVLRAELTASAQFEMDAPGVLEPGEHAIEVTVGRGMYGDELNGRLVLESESGTVELVTDDRWEVLEESDNEVYPDRWSPDQEERMATIEGSERWVGVLPVGSTMAGSHGDDSGKRFGHVLTDAAWLEGEEVLAGQVPQLWAESAEQPPPAWFCFTAPPGAAAITLPIVGDVQAWVDGAEASVEDESLTLSEGARVAVRVQAPRGYRGAACFREHSVLTLADGHIRTGISWHRQGLDSFVGIVRHRATIEWESETDAVLDLGHVRGSVGVRVNGEEAGVMICAPWRLPVRLRQGENTIELDVASALGPLAGRGIPTQFGPEDQRITGILGRPRLLVPA